MICRRQTLGQEDLLQLLTGSLQASVRTTRRAVTPYMYTNTNNTANTVPLNLLRSMAGPCC
jgi:hypothetical protein